MKRSLGLLLALMMLVALMASLSAQAASVYYVRTDGSDSNDGSADDATHAWLTLQHAVDSVLPGDTIHLAAGSYVGGVTVDVNGLTLIGGEGVVVTGGSSALVIDADHVILADLDLDGQGTHPVDAGLVAHDGVVNLLVERCTVHGWGQDGLQFLGAISGVKLIDNLIHDNGSDGVEFAATPTGLINIYGNAFRSNAGYGLNHTVVSPAEDVRAEYNAWGHVAGPASGDGVSTGVDADPWVHGALWIVPATQTVREGESASLDVRMDVHHLYGAELELTLPTGVLQLTAEPALGAFKTTTEGSSFAATSMAAVNSTGNLAFTGYRALPDAEYDASDDPLFTLALQAQEISGSSQMAVVQFLPGAGQMGAKGGVHIKLESLADGVITVLGTTSLSGVVDLQGRANEGGAVVDASAGATYGWDPAAGTTDLWGEYVLSDLTDDSYTVSIEMARYLDASATVAVAGDSQTLGLALLLGGDANDDDMVDISDMSLIGGQYGLSGGSITDQRADINADMEVDILDLVLAGGNYALTSSPWTP